jgi:hypothetical protein
MTTTKGNGSAVERTYTRYTSLEEMLEGIRCMLVREIGLNGEFEMFYGWLVNRLKSGPETAGTTGEEEPRGSGEHHRAREPGRGGDDLLDGPDVRRGTEGHVELQVRRGPFAEGDLPQDLGEPPGGRLRVRQPVPLAPGLVEVVDRSCALERVARGRHSTKVFKTLSILVG